MPDGASAQLKVYRRYCAENLGPFVSNWFFVLRTFCSSLLKSLPNSARTQMPAWVNAHDDACIKYQMRTAHDDACINYEMRTTMIASITPCP